MKRLIRKKWFRRSTQAVVIGASLLGLANAAANRRAAGAKRDALDALKSGGNLIEAAKFKVEMPPDEENFAMIPLLVKLREENGLNSMTFSGVYDSPEAKDLAGTKIASLGADTKGVPVRRSHQGEPLPPNLFAERLGLKGSASEMLEQFDQRHAEVLNALREGKGRRWTVMPPRIDLSNPGKAYTTGCSDLIKLSYASLGIAMRAELALDAGRGDIALESLLINRRLSDLVMSEGLGIGQFVAWGMEKQSMPPLLRGISSGAWDAASLERLREAWGGRNNKEVLERMLNLEGVVMAIYCEHWKMDRSLGARIMGEDGDFLSRMQQSAVPDFWFDANTAQILLTTEKSLELVRKDGPLQSWWDELGAQGGSGYPGPSWIREMETPFSTPKGIVEKICDVDSPSIGALVGSALKRGSRAMVDESLARLACLLGEYKIAHGSYPPSLDAIGGSDIIDPLSGKAFIYRVNDGKFQLYSVGPNGIDDGASRKPKSFFGTPEQSDWVW
jgi:hypothetical protein